MSRWPGPARVAGSHRPGRARAAAHRGAGAEARDQPAQPQGL